MIQMYKQGMLISYVTILSGKNWASLQLYNNYKAKWKWKLFWELSSNLKKNERDTLGLILETEIGGILYSFISSDAQGEICTTGIICL